MPTRVTARSWRAFRVRSKPASTPATIGCGGRTAFRRSSAARPPILFFSGCSPNQGAFYPQLDHILLLTAPPAVIVARLATRTTNPYGKRPAEVARVLALQQTIEPLPRRSAHHVIDTTGPLDQVVRHVLQLVGESP